MKPMRTAQRTMVISRGIRTIPTTEIARSTANGTINTSPPMPHMVTLKGFSLIAAEIRRTGFGIRSTVTTVMIRMPRKMDMEIMANIHDHPSHSSLRAFVTA